MNTDLKWQYNETRQIGADYADPSEVQAYDSRMQKSCGTSRSNPGCNLTWKKILYPGEHLTLGVGA